MVRPARPSDKGDLMSFIKDVWGGHDYIPYVWDEWLNGKDGRMFVAEVGGRAVGMNRVRFMGDGSAWFEGVRVHPDYRGRGLATMLGENSAKVALSEGAKTFRLVSGSRNKLAHRQIARMGFEEASRISVYAPPKRARTPALRGARRAKPGEGPRALRAMENSKEFKLGSGVYWDAFAAQSLTLDVVGRLVDAGQVWVSPKAVAVTAFGGEGSPTWRQVCFIGGDPDEARVLALRLFGLKGGRRPTRKLAYLPQGSKVITSMREHGFERHGSLILFERKAAKG